MKKLISIYIILITFFSCQKLEVEPDFIGSPVFSVPLNVEGQSLELVAGNDNYFQFTGKAEFNNYTEFFGELKEENCDLDCPPSLKMTFRSNDIEQLFQDGEVNYLESVPSVQPRVKTTLTAEATGIGEIQYLWEFEDNTTLEGETVEKDFDFGSIQKVKLKTIDSDGCENRQEREINLEQTPSPSISGCEDYSIIMLPQFDSMSGQWINNFFVLGISSQNFASDLIWSDDTIFPFLCIPADSLPEELCVEVFPFNSNCPPVSTCLSIQSTNSSNPSSSFCTAKFHYENELILEPQNVDQLESVVIEYTNENGDVFSSKDIPQNNSTFRVTNFENYEQNNNGNPTIKFSGNFSCNAISQNGEIIDIQSSEFTFAIEK